MKLADIMKRFITVIAILSVLSIAWTAFVKPEKDSGRDNTSDMVENISVGSQDVETDNPGLSGLKKFWDFSGFRNATKGHLIMIVVGLFFIFLAIKYDYEPLC